MLHFQTSCAYVKIFTCGAKFLKLIYSGPRWSLFGVTPNIDIKIRKCPLRRKQKMNCCFQKSQRIWKTPNCGVKVKSILCRAKIPILNCKSKKSHLRIKIRKIGYLIQNLYFSRGSSIMNFQSYPLLSRRNSVIACLYKTTQNPEFRKFFLKNAIKH